MYGLAATTLLAVGLLVSIFDFVDLLLLTGAVFFPTSDFFSIVASPMFDLTALRSTLVQTNSQTPRLRSKTFKPLKTKARVLIVRLRARLMFVRWGHLG
jgi:hypothetical protein